MNGEESPNLQISKSPNKKSGSGYKPDSVIPKRLRDSGRQPSVYATNTRNSSAACSSIIPYLVLLRKGFTMRPSFQISPVGSCPTFSPLPWIFANPWRFVFCGTFLTAESGPQHPEELSRPGTSRTVESGLSSPETP